MRSLRERRTTQLPFPLRIPSQFLAYHDGRREKIANMAPRRKHRATRAARTPNEEPMGTAHTKPSVWKWLAEHFDDEIKMALEWPRRSLSNY